jgi:hypothetical protein
MSRARNLTTAAHSRNVEGPQRAVGPTPWYVRAITSISERSSRIRARYQQQSTSGQIAGTADTYATKLQSTWRSGGTHGGRADPITQVQQTPSVMTEWPSTPGGDSAPSMPSNRTRRQDQRPSLAGERRPTYYQRWEPYERHHSTDGPHQHMYAQDFLPVRFAVVPPLKITRMHRPGISLMAGIAQYGTRQTWGQGEASGVLPPVQTTLGAKSRGVRSIRGVLGGAGLNRGSGRERIPAIFTPTSIQ